MKTCYSNGAHLREGRKNSYLKCPVKRDQGKIEPAPIHIGTKQKVPMLFILYYIMSSRLKLGSQSMSNHQKDSRPRIFQNNLILQKPEGIHRGRIIGIKESQCIWARSRKAMPEQSSDIRNSVAHLGPPQGNNCLWINGWHVDGPHPR